jgi:hypothetical protein
MIAAQQLPDLLRRLSALEKKLGAGPGPSGTGS